MRPADSDFAFDVTMISGLRTMPLPPPGVVARRAAAWRGLAGVLGIVACEAALVPGPSPDPLLLLVAAVVAAGIVLVVRRRVLLGGVLGVVACLLAGYAAAFEGVVHSAAIDTDAWMILGVLLAAFILPWRSLLGIGLANLGVLALAFLLGGRVSLNQALREWLFVAAATALTIVLAGTRRSAEGYRRDAEESLRRSRERYRNIVDSQADFVCRFTPDLKITYANEAYCRFHGITRQSAVGKSLLELIPEKEHARVRAFLSALGPDDRPAPSELLTTNRAGESRWILWRDRPILSADGRIVEFQSHGGDVTEAHAAREALGASRERLLHQQAELGELARIIQRAEGDDALRLITEAGQRCIGQVRTSVWRLNADASSMRCLDVLNYPSRQHEQGAELLRSTAPAFFESLPHEALIESDFPDTDPRLVGAATWKGADQVCSSGIGATVFVDGGAAGFVAFEQIGPARPWQSEDRLFALSVANLVALLFSREARAAAQAEVARRNRLLRALNENIPSLLAAQGEAELCRVAVSAALNVLESADGFFYVVDREAQVLRERHATGVFSRFGKSPVRKGEGLIGRVWERGDSLALENYSTWEGRRPGFDDLAIRSVAAVPIFAAGEVAGVLGVALSSIDGNFDPVAVSMLKRFAQFAAISFELTWARERLQEELVQRRQVDEEIRRLNADLEARVHERTLELANAIRAVQASERYLRSILEAEPECVMVLDADGVVLSVNPAGVALADADSEQEVVGRRLRERVCPEHASTFDELLAAALAGVPQAAEIETVTLRGRQRWADTRAVLIRGDLEQTARVLVIQRDVTERHRAESQRQALQAEIERSVREWRATFDAVESPVLLVDRSGAVRRGNKAAQAELGPTLDLGRQSAVPWVNTRELALRSLVEAKPLGENAADPRDGRSWELSASPLMTPEGMLAVAIVRDVSDVAELQASLRRSETLSAVGELVAGVAHEVRNPLFAMSANLDCLEDEMGHDAAQSTYVQHLRSEMSRLEQLMRELLDYARPAVTAPTPTSVQTLLETVLDACRARAQQHAVEIRLALQRDLPVLSMDVQRIRQVFQNLIENAIHFSPRGGAVAVEACLASDGAGIEISVLDEGKGFDEDDLQRVFEPFFTRRRGGTGLGLAIARRVVEEHHGSIAAANRTSGGGAVRVRLPTG